MSVPTTTLPGPASCLARSSSDGAPVPGFLLDTNVVSELRKGGRADSNVRSWFSQHVADELWVSALVVGELRRGVELIRRRDESAADNLDRWLTSVVDDFGDRVLPITAAIADRWGRLNASNTLPAIDGFLAATALEHDLTLVTRNTGDVATTGCRLVDPFAPPAGAA